MNDLKANDFGHSKSLRCLSWNVRSLNNKVEDVMEFVNDNDVSMFLIQETWLTDANNHTTAIVRANGFNIFHIHRCRLTGGGVAIAFRHNLKLVQVFTKIYESFEAVSVRLIQKDHKNLLVSCI